MILDNTFVLIYRYLLAESQLTELLILSVF